MPRPFDRLPTAWSTTSSTVATTGQPVFDERRRLRGVPKAIADLKERKPFDLYGYCLMSNHIHLLIRPREDVDQPHRAEPAGFAHAALSPLSSQRRACMARPIQEPGHPERRSSADGAAIYRGQSAAGGDGEAGGSIGGAVSPATAWAKRSAPGSGPRYEALAAYAAVRQRRWSAYVHQAPEEAELAAIRRSSETGLPYGERSVGGPLMPAIEARPDDSVAWSPPKDTEDKDGKHSK